MKTGCIIQARMTSSRLPGKVLKILDYSNNTTILDEVVSRVQRSKRIDQIIIATTKNKDDNPIEELANKFGITCYRGSELDVLERFYKASCENELDRIIRVTSDCPFIDPMILDEIINVFDCGKYDYVSNAMKRTFPHGLDCEIFSFEALERAYSETKFIDKDLFYREHVTTYIYGHPEIFRLGNYCIDTGKDYSDIRITVDTKQDYVLACVLKALLEGKYTYKDIISLFEEKPFLSEINKSSVQKKKFESKEEEINMAVRFLELQEMKKAANILKNACEGDK